MDANNKHASKFSATNDHDTSTESDSDPTSPAFWTVAVYFVQQQYGGREEGGWWYDAGYPVDPSDGMRNKELPLPRIFTNEEDAYAAARSMQDILDATVNQGRRNKYSVLTTGVYEAHAVPGFPVPFPAERPHYE